MTVATCCHTMTHQVGSTGKIGQDMRHDLVFCAQLRTGIWSCDSPVCRDVTPELYAPEVEQTTHEVSLTKKLVTGLFLTSPVESVHTIDNGTGTGNTYVDVFPCTIKESLFVGHQVTDSVCLNVTSTTGTITLIRHNVVHEPRSLEGIRTHLVHHTIQGSQLLGQVTSRSRIVLIRCSCIIFGIEEVLARGESNCEKNRDCH